MLKVNSMKSRTVLKSFDALAFDEDQRNRLNLATINGPQPGPEPVRDDAPATKPVKLARWLVPASPCIHFE